MHDDAMDDAAMRCTMGAMLCGDAMHDEAMNDEAMRCTMRR